MTAEQPKRLESEIISADERIRRDPRGLARFTILGNGQFGVKKQPDTEELQTQDQVAEQKRGGEQDG